MRPLIVVLFIVAGCSANTPPSAPYSIPTGTAAAEEPVDGTPAKPTPEPEPRVEPTVVAQGFTANSEVDSASYAVVIENPNSTWWPRFVNVRITFLDAYGTALTTETQNITGILPESETAVAGEALEAGGATTMEVEVSSLNLLPNRIRSSLGDTGRYDYERVETARDESGEIKTTGLVVSRFGSEQINVPIAVVYYDAAGKVVGGAITHVDQLPPGGRATFEASTSVTLLDVAETRVFGQIGFGS